MLRWPCFTVVDLCTRYMHSVAFHIHPVTGVEDGLDVSD